MDRSEAHDAAGSWASLRRRYGDCCPRGHLAARRCGLPNAAPEEPRGPAPWWPRDLLPRVAGPHRL